MDVTGGRMSTFTLNINGADHKVEAVPDMPLLWALRDLVGLTGAKYGCGVSACGACTVILDGEAVRSCQIQLSSIGTKKITTIEGLSSDGSHFVQKAWLEHDVPQCGYCQTGQIMQVAALLKKNPHPTDAEIDDAMGAHICRCGSYVRIREAIKSAIAEGAK